MCLSLYIDVSGHPLGHVRTSKCRRYHTMIAVVLVWASYTDANGLASAAKAAQRGLLA